MTLELDRNGVPIYIVRRRRDFAKLTELGDQTAVSDDIKSHLLLKLSELIHRERSQVIASCNNKYDLGPIESALCTQFPNVQE